MELWHDQAMFAIQVSQLIAYIWKQNYFCTLGEAWRSQEQAELYAKEGKGICHSLHCDRLAIDLLLHDKQGNYLTDPKIYEPFGIYWETLDPKNRNGRHFPRPDSNHFERMR